MEIFKTNKRIFSLLSIYPVTKGTKNWLKIFNIVYSLLSFVLLTGCIIGNFFFMMMYIAVDLENGLNALFAMMGLIPALYSFATFYIMRKKLVQIIREFQRICDSSNFSKKIQIWMFKKKTRIISDEDGKFLFALTNEKNEKVANFLIKYVFPTVCSSFLPMNLISYCYYVYVNGSDNVDINGLYTPLKVVYVLWIEIPIVRNI